MNLYNDTIFTTVLFQCLLFVKVLQVGSRIILPLATFVNLVIAVGFFFFCRGELALITEALSRIIGILLKIGILMFSLNRFQKESLQT